MKDPSDSEFETPLTPDLFAKTFHLPPAMVRLTIECGLEAPDGRITAVSFCQWLTAHYNQFRKAAGLPELVTATKSMLVEKRAHVTIGNVLKTLADYFASRTSSLEYKEAWMHLSNEIGTCSQKKR